MLTALQKKLKRAYHKKFQNGSIFILKSAAGLKITFTVVAMPLLLLRSRLLLIQPFGLKIAPLNIS